MSFKSSRLVTCSFPSDIRRRSSRTMSSNSFSFAVTSLLKMCRSFGSHDIHSILGYVACLFSMVPYACVVLHASLFKRKTLHACCHWVPHSTIKHWATMRRWASHWQNPSKRSRPMSLWELNPLVLAYRAKSFPKTELQLRVLNKLASLEEFHLPSLWDFWTYCWRLLSDYSGSCSLKQSQSATHT